MKLVMFDMDGTLTDSFAIDENCYVLAISQALGLTDIVTAWDSYTHASASYCLQEIVRTSRGEPVTEAESRAVQQRMIGLMDEIAFRRGRGTAEIPGAADCVRELRRRNIAVAIASGDWESTARHKLASAGIPFENLPSAYCDVSHARAEIMQSALRRAAAHYGCAQFERVVYVGDAPWDVRACRELGWPLVAVAQGRHAARLKSLGAAEVIADYRRLGDFLAALEAAAVPGNPG
jgi:beta-phosphoglucomutase-like phosphatase (HAD superfamily)